MNIKTDKQPVFLLFFKSRKPKAQMLWILLGLIICTILIILTNPLSLISFFIFLFLAVALYFILLGTRNFQQIVKLFLFYAIIAIVLYWAQLLTVPEWNGASGPLGIGTDDYRFYYEAVNDVTISPSFEVLFGKEIHNYSRFLQSFMLILPRWNEHLLDLLFINVFALSFVPILTSRVALLLTNKENVAELAFKFCTICPILMSNSLILIRDGWIALLFILAVYALLKRRYILLVLSVVLLFYLRIASFVQLFVVLLIFIFYEIKDIEKNGIKKAIPIVIIFLIIVTFVVSMSPAIDNYVIDKGIANNLYFREDFVEGFIARSAQDKGDVSTLYNIYQQSAYIRIPVGFAFFLGAPFLSLKNLAYNDIYIPRAFLSQIFALLFIFYLKYFIQALFCKIKHADKKIMPLLISFILILLMISQMSIQIRHKTMLMPLFYIIVAYGYYNKSRWGQYVGIICIVLLIFISLVINIAL